MCKKFRDYLHHSFVDIYTDFNHVVYILKKTVSQRWCAELAKFNFKIHYRSGKTNTATDSLSRMVEPDQPDPLVLKQWCKDVLADDHKPTDTSVKSICKPIHKILQEQAVKALLGSYNDGFPTCEQSHISAIQNKISDDDESQALDKIDMVVGDNTQIDFQELQNNDETLQFIINNVYNQPSVEYAIVRHKHYVIKNL